jgi:hypothetical protein
MKYICLLFTPEVKAHSVRIKESKHLHRLWKISPVFLAHVCAATPDPWLLIHTYRWE